MKLVLPATLISSAVAWAPTCHYKFSGASQIAPDFSALDHYDDSHTVNSKALKRLKSSMKLTKPKKPSKKYNQFRSSLFEKKNSKSKRTRAGNRGRNNKFSRAREEEDYNSNYEYANAEDDYYEEIDYDYVETEEDYDEEIDYDNDKVDEDDYYVEMDYDIPVETLEEIPRVIMLLDKTDSMKPISSATVDAYNRFLQEQQHTLKGEVYTPKITTIQFEYWFDEIAVYNDIMNAQPYSNSDYVPEGCTSLYDAIGCTIEQYKEEKNNIFMVITDGDDTCSELYDKYAIRNLVDEVSRPVSEGGQGWQFTFQGANVDSRRFAQDLGMKMFSTFTADESGINTALNKSSRTLKKLRTRSGLQMLRASKTGGRSSSSRRRTKARKMLKSRGFQRNNDMIQF